MSNDQSVRTTGRKVSPELVDNHAHAVQSAPYHEITACVPQAAEQHGNHRVQVGPYLFAAVRTAQSHRTTGGTEHQYASGHIKVAREDGPRT